VTERDRKSGDRRPELTPEESALLEQLLYLTGREDRLSRTPLVAQEQIAGIRAVWPLLRAAASRALDLSARCDLLNRLLLALGVHPVSVNFFETVFGELDFSDTRALRERVQRFRALCMLEFGNFRYGYKRFRDGKDIAERWRRYFPSREDVTQRARELRSRLETAGLTQIAPSQLFSLGYLASEHAPAINGARKRLLAVITRALTDEVSDFSGLQAAATKEGVDDLTALLAKAGIPGTEELIYSDMPLFGGGKRTYSEILRTLEQNCVTVDEDAIRQARQDGLQNSRTYMALSDLDVYVATSMREPLHFTTNWAFVQSLFHQGDLAEWRLRYFDPTQAFLEDRIQKGLLECLMIKRARLTVYNAQEADTFGKDAEAGVTLAQRKPVIVYVARLFDHLEALRTLYAAIDEGARVDRDPFIQSLVEKGLLSEKGKQELLGPEKTKADVVKAVITANASEPLQKLSSGSVALELIRQGYDPQRARGNVVAFAVDRMQTLERRALTFRDAHPLSLQTSPIDGVARGVMVTRTVTATAEVVRGLFLGTLGYELVEDDWNWLLVDAVTRSPVRVVTKDPILTTAFWSENWTEV